MKPLLLFSILFLTCLVTIQVYAESPAASSAPSGNYLRVRSDPDNLLYVGGTGYYKSSESVTLSKMPDTWRDYTFLGWQIDGSWSPDNPPKILMNSSHEVVAVFEKGGGVGGAVLVDSIPRIAEITVDDNIYLPGELPVSLNWEADSNHVVIVNPIVNENANKRYVFDGWKDRQPDAVRTVKTGDTNELIALYKIQYYFKALTEYGDAKGGGWYDEGSTIPFSLDSEHVTDRNDDTVRYSFDSWDTGDYKNSASNSISVDGPLTVTANWKKEYKLEIRSNVPDFIPPGSGFYPTGKNLALIAEPEIESPNSDIKYIFDKWVSIGQNPVVISNSLSPSTSIVVDSSFIIEARYKKSFLVNAWSQYGTTSGGGFYEDGQIADVRMNQNEQITIPGQEKKIFAGWNTGTANILKFDAGESESLEPAVNPNLQIMVDSPVNVTAKWNSQYYLDVQSSTGIATGAGWYSPGTLVPISVKMPTESPGMWASYTFSGWSGDVESTSPTTKIIMTGSKSVVAEWQEDTTPGIINGLILAGVGVTGFLIYYIIRKSGRFSLGPFLKSNSNAYTGDRRGLDAILQHRPKMHIPPRTSYPQDARLPKKKSAFDWLMGNDK